MDKPKIIVNFIDYRLNKFRCTSKIRKEIAETIINQTIYHNDLGCYLWSFDYKLPCGVLCENIRWSGDLTEVKCLVCL